MLQKLKGEAFDKLEHVTTGELMVENCVDVFKEKIVDAYEPVEDYRVGKIMDHFLYDFHRKRDEEIVAYNQSWASSSKRKS